MTTETVEDVKVKESDKQKLKPLPVKEKPKGFLPDDIRQNLVKQLTDFGVDASSLDDNELLIKQSSLTRGFHDQVVVKETDKMQLIIDQWKSNQDSLLTDDEFIIRLINLSVHVRYAKLFRDNDRVLRDDKIWDRIRVSGIDPLDGKSLGGILSRQR